MSVPHRPRSIISPTERRLMSQGMVRPNLLSEPFYVDVPSELAPIDGGPGMYALTRDLYAAPLVTEITRGGFRTGRMVPAFRPNRALSNPELR